MNNIKEQEEALFNRWKGKKTNWVKDGVISPETFAARSPKVLYILKEANGGKEKKWIGGDLRKFLTNVDRWYTWNTVARWQYGIDNLKNEIDWKKVDHISKPFREEMIGKAAVINLKKEPGSQQAKNEEIKYYAERDLKHIHEQISIYNPDIVVCGGTGEIVKELKILGSFNSWEISERGVGYRNIDEITILNCSHPGIRSSKKKLFWDIVHTLREIYLQEEKID